MSPWRIFSQKGINTGISSSPQKQGLSILGSQSIDSEKLIEDFGCCCKVFSCGNCDSDAIEGELAYDTSGGLFTHVDLFPGRGSASSWGDIPFASDKPYKSPPVGTNRFKNRAEIGSIFATSIAGTFDAVAIERGFAICLYASEYFEGSPYAVIKGPKIINNILFLPASQGGVNNYIWDREGLESIYDGPYYMYWSNVNMRGSYWERPGSIVLCRTLEDSQVFQYGFGLYNGYPGGEVYTPRNPLVE